MSELPNMLPIMTPLLIMIALAIGGVFATLTREKSTNKYNNHIIFCPNCSTEREMCWESYVTKLYKHICMNCGYDFTIDRPLDSSSPWHIPRGFA